MDKPIIFSTDMVRAILAGRKTKTRRVIKPQPEGRLMYCYAGSSNSDIGKWHHGGKRYTPPCHGDDALWVRETWAEYVPGCPPPRGFSYRADHIDPKGDGPANPMKWRSSIHMPKEAARLWLRVTSVSVERLQDITEEDAKVEGISYDQAMECSGWSPTYNDPDGSSARPNYREAFAELWDCLNAKRGFSFNSNPWVWVIEFEVIDNG